jgi:hypothetical protein
VGKHVIYQSSMEIMQMLLEDAEKNTLITEGQIIVLAPLLTIDSDSQNVVGCWPPTCMDGRPDLRRNLPSVPDLLQLVQVPPMLLCIIHYKTAVLPLSQTLQELAPRDAPASHTFCQGILQQSTKDPAFSHRFYTWMNLASLD